MHDAAKRRATIEKSFFDRDRVSIFSVDDFDHEP
jgi:hypothetical protein